MQAPFCPALSSPALWEGPKPQSPSFCPALFPMGLHSVEGERGRTGCKGRGGLDSCKCPQGISRATCPSDTRSSLTGQPESARWSRPPPGEPGPSVPQPPPGLLPPLSALVLLRLMIILGSRGRGGPPPQRLNHWLHPRYVSKRLGCSLL